MGRVKMKNKKGFYGISSFPLGLIGFFIILIVALALVTVQDSNGAVSAETQLSSLSALQTKFGSEFATSPEKDSLSNLINSFVGFVIYSSLEIAKLAIKYAGAHPDVVNPKSLLWLVTAALILPIAVSLLKFGIALFILIKEWIESSKEKRKLKRLKEQRLDERKFL